MKKITIPTIACLSGIAMMLSSCGSMQQSTAFSKRKYYNFRHNDPVVVFNKDTKKRTQETTTAPSATETNCTVTVHTQTMAKTPVAKPVCSQTEQKQKSIPERPSIAPHHSQSPTTSSSVTSRVSSAANKMAPTNTTGGSSSISPIVLILLAIFISPLGVYLYDNNTTKRFWIDLILWLLGIGIVGLFYFFGLLWLAAVVYAILIVTGSV